MRTVLLALATWLCAASLPAQGFRHNVEFHPGVQLSVIDYAGTLALVAFWSPDLARGWEFVRFQRPAPDTAVVALDVIDSGVLDFRHCAVDSRPILGREGTLAVRSWPTTVPAMGLLLTRFDEDQPRLSFVDGLGSHTAWTFSYCHAACESACPPLLAAPSWAALVFRVDLSLSPE